MKPIVSKETFQAIVRTVGETGYYKRGQELVDLTMLILRQRNEVFETITKFSSLLAKSGSVDTAVFSGLNEQLDNMLPHHFLKTFTEEQLLGSLRYLKSLGIRTQRAYANPAKDAEKQKKMVPHLRNQREYQDRLDDSNTAARERFYHYSRLVAEYQVSLFSPEIKTMIPVSEKKLAAAWKKLNEQY